MAALFDPTAVRELVLGWGSLFAGSTVAFVAIGFAWERSSAGRRRRIFALPVVRFHRWHHASRITTPLSGQSLGIVEAAGWICGLLLVPATLTEAGLLHGGALAAYLVISAAGNIVGHANADPHPRQSGERARSWATHPFTYHALHHARWTGHYGLGTTVPDRVLGSEWADWPALHARVISGEPLRSFKERGD